MILLRVGIQSEKNAGDLNLRLDGRNEAKEIKEEHLMEKKKGGVAKNRRVECVSSLHDGGVR